MEISLITLWFRKLLDALRIRKPLSREAAVDRPMDRRKETFTVVSDGIKIRGWVRFPVAAPARLYPVVVICHGIPGSGTARPQNDPGYEALAQELVSTGVAAVVFNFRGCGDSGGDFDMLGWTRDLEAVLDRILNTPHLDPTRVMLVGFSGGGAAAIKVAADNPKVYALASVAAPANFDIFENTPSKIIEDFRKRGLIKDPDFPPNVERWIDGFREIEPRRWIAFFKGKKALILHGDQDELIPVEHARELAAAAPGGVAELSIIPGGVHRLRLDPRCVEELKKWIGETLR